MIQKYLLRCSHHSHAAACGQDGILVVFCFPIGLFAKSSTLHSAGGHDFRPSSTLDPAWLYQGFQVCICLHAQCMQGTFRL